MYCLLCSYVKSDRMEHCRPDFSVSFCTLSVLDNQHSGSQAQIASRYSKTCEVSKFSDYDSGHISVIRRRKQLHWHTILAKQYKLALFLKACCVSMTPTEGHVSSGWMQIQLHGFQIIADSDPEKFEGRQKRHV